MQNMKKYQLVALRDEIKNSPGSDRAMLIAYGLLRGKAYRQIEPRTRDTIAMAKYGAGPSLARSSTLVDVWDLLVQHGPMSKEEAKALAIEVMKPPPDVPIVVPTPEQAAARKERAAQRRGEGLERQATRKVAS